MESEIGLYKCTPKKNIPKVLINVYSHWESPEQLLGKLKVGLNINVMTESSDSIYISIHCHNEHVETETKNHLAPKPKIT
jgi:hypothetical protein